MALIDLHFHMLCLNGIFDANGYFWPVKPPTPEDLDTITRKIAKRVFRYLERAGYLYRDAESEYLDLVPDEDDVLHEIIGASTDASDRTYQLAFGPNHGKKSLTLQSVASRAHRMKASELVSKQAGFSLHAGVAHKSQQRKEDRNYNRAFRSKV